MLDAEVVEGLRELEKDDNEGVVESLYALFQKNAEKSFAAIEAGIAIRDFGMIGAAAHSLRSSSLNLGAVELVEACAEIEMRAGQGEFSGIPEGYAKCRAVYPAVNEELTALVASLKS
jgi:HPt (histidine-containing phosphotransfer) domain-containing protein